jgi:hypothetical protein
MYGVPYCGTEHVMSMYSWTHSYVLKMHASVCVYISCARVERVKGVRVAAGNVPVFEYQQRTAITNLHIFAF